MSIEHETTAEEIAALLNDDGSIDATRANGRFASDSTESTSAESGVTVEQCKRWRRSIHRPSVTLTALAKRADVNVTTVRYHVRDACSHDVDGPRVKGDQR